MIAREAMTPAPRTSVAAALRLARDNGISRLPVVERGQILDVVRQERLLAALVTEDDQLVGILTHSDLLRALVLDEPEAVA